MRKPGETSEPSICLTDTYGEPLPVSVNEWIYATYDFINAVLSGYYDVEDMGLDIIDGIKNALDDEHFSNGYIRNINYRG